MVETIEADAEKLPFADGSFDAVTSTFGVMFAPNHVAAASEMMRVCRPGGRIALANWTPEGFIGELFRTVGRLVPPPAGVMSPALWGKPEHLAALFHDGIRQPATITKKHFNFRYESAAHFIDIFRLYYGPTHKAFLALDDNGKATLNAELEALLAKWDCGGGRGLVVSAEYAEVIAIRR